MDKHKDILQKNWSLFLSFLPEGWQKKARELGVIQRKRHFKSAEDLLRVLLIHIAEGCSLRETAVRARLQNIASVSDVAILKKLRSSSEWLRWMAMGVLEKLCIDYEKPESFHKYHIQLIDATVVRERGRTGSIWRLHYGIDLFQLNCEHFILTEESEGETFLRFPCHPNDLFIADRAYCSYRGFHYVLRANAHFIVRYTLHKFLMRYKGKELNLRKALQTLKVDEIRIFPVEISIKGHPPLSLWLYVLRKRDDIVKRDQERLVRLYKKKRQKLPGDIVLELAKYIVLISSLDPIYHSPLHIFALYRNRWQIEIAFKMLKSLMGMGYLPKYDKQSCKAWLHGKILTSFLIQAFILEGRKRSPWGYLLSRKTKFQFMA